MFRKKWIVLVNSKIGLFAAILGNYRIGRDKLCVFLVAEGMRVFRYLGKRHT